MQILQSVHSPQRRCDLTLVINVCEAATSPGWGIPYETDGDARCLAQGSEFWIFVSLRVFRAKRQYFKPPRSRLGFCEELEIYDNAFKNCFQIKAFEGYVLISLKLIACRICVFLSGLFQGSKFAQATPRLVSFRGHKKLEPRSDGLLQGLNSKLPTSIPVCFIWEFPPPPGRRDPCSVLPMDSTNYKKSVLNFLLS